MEFSEFAKLAKAMKAVYTQPNFLPNDFAMKLWHNMLKDIPYDIACVAVENYIATNRYAPTIADIRAYAVQMIMPQVSNWSEAWGNVLFAITAYGAWDEKTALGYLKEADPIAERVVKRLGWKELCASENLIADRANFRDAYEMERKQTADRAATRAGFQQIAKSEMPELLGR